MCGYDIYFGNTATGKVVEDVLSKKSDNMFRRGPDESSRLHLTINNKQLVIRHFRLNIIGESSGSQPKESKDHILLFNGEIFNFQELGRDHLGVNYYSDTEFLFDILSNHNFDLIKECDGFFTFSFINRKTGEILCGRDTFGIKPLLRIQLTDGHYYTTDVKLAYEVAKRFSIAINKDTLNEFLLFGNPQFGKKYLNNITDIDPGRITSFTEKTASTIADISTEGVFDEKEYRKSISSWRYPHEDVNFSISGGIDSNAVQFNLINDGDTNIYLHYTNEDINYYNELTTLNNNNLPIDIIEKNDEDLNSDLLEIMDAYYEPYSGGIPSFWVYENIKRKNMKICYTGVGGDELFGGYGITSVRLRSIIKALIKGHISEAKLFCSTKTRSYFNIIELNKDEKIQLLQIYRHKSALSLNTVLHSLLENQFLTACDRFGMYHSVEVRPPLLNVNAPGILHTCDDQKTILRQMTGKDHVFNHQKTGFTIGASDIVKTDFVQSYKNQAVELCQNLLGITFSNPSDTLLLRCSSFYHFYLKLKS